MNTDTTARFSLLAVVAVAMLFMPLSCADSDGDKESKNTDTDAPEPQDDYEISGVLYYVSAEDGSDENPGTLDAPFATILFALSQVSSGDGIIAMNGDYGDLTFGAQADGQPIENVFSDWVTLKAMDGHSPELGTVTLGTWLEAGSSDQMSFDQVGNSNLYLRLDGFQIRNGLTVYGSRHVDIRNCHVELEAEDLTQVMEEHGMGVLNGQHVQFLNNEITHAGIGITAMTTDFVMKGNEIHHCAHDGLKIYGGANWLVEDNTIHDLDDGVDDDEGADYNMHVDGIHLHMIIHEGGYYHRRWAGGAYNMTFRGNFIYHTEAMGVMINTCDSGMGHYANWVWENNVFGPTGGILFILGAEIRDSFVFRHNTVLFTPEDRWTSMWGREMGENFADPRGQPYFVQVWGNPEGHEIYNNIFTSATTLEQDQGLIVSNLYYSGTDADLGPAGAETAAPAHEPISGLLDDYLAEGNIPGTLTGDSPAINNGYISEPSVSDDFAGNPRDSQPDIGALEKAL